ncbi:hypothetical protein BC834DRAFT_921408 [Gloeopeniophorella convolvens]|nr:hypothetical protein BC834DRAFT_921408 [Gloeopeniophorella convolvens]
MALDTHIRRGHPILFGLIVLFAIVELSISAWLVVHFDKHHNAPFGSVSDRSAFLLFASAWTILVTLILGLLFLHAPGAGGSALSGVGAHAVILGLTWIFWTAGAASITAALGGGLKCGHTDFPYCGQLNALEAFAWIEWILTTLALVAVLLLGARAFRRGDGYRGKLVYA